MNKKIKTKFGTATIQPDGYYKIKSRKEGNRDKLLHRLVWEDHYGKPVPKGYVIHHINEDKTDNRIQNLQCVEQGVHRRFHMKGKRNINYGKEYSEEYKFKIGLKSSQLKNTTGYFRVTKKNDKTCSQGFVWSYRYHVNGKRKQIGSVDINKLERKVKSKGLPWFKLEEEL